MARVQTASSKSQRLRTPAARARGSALKRRPPVRRIHDSVATREALIRAATGLFAERGFEGVSVDQIAVASGVNKTLINYHFGGKAGLYSEILHAVFGSMSEGLREIRERGGAPEARLRAVIREIGRMVSSHPGLPQMVLREVLSGGEHIDHSTLPHFLELFGAVRTIVEAGMRSGAFRRVNPFATHIGLIGSIMFFFSTERFRQNKVATLPPGFEQPLAPDYLAHIEELMVRGLAAQPRRARARR